MRTSPNPSFHLKAVWGKFLNNFKFEIPDFPSREVGHFLSNRFYEMIKRGLVEENRFLLFFRKNDGFIFLENEFALFAGRIEFYDNFGRFNLSGGRIAKRAVSSN